MQIDWFTFGAQIVNFLILIVLLRRFLYKPVVQAMDNREQRIAAQIEETEREREQAKQEVASLRQKRQEIEERRTALLAQAEDAAEEHRQKMIKQARAEVEDVRVTWQDTVRREKDVFLHHLNTQVGEQVFQVARRALADLTDTDLERQLINVFVNRLQAIDLQAVTEASHDSQEAILYSAFELPREARDHLTSAVHQQTGDHLKLRFETEPELIGGILMKINDYQLGWNLRDYLQAMEDRLSEVLENDATETGPPAALFEEEADQRTSVEQAE